MVRTLAVAVTCLGLCARAETFPVGTTWKWTVAAGGGRAERVAWVLEGAAPPARRVVERWTLEVGKPNADGKVPTKLRMRGQDGDATFQLLVWEEGGVLVFRAADKPQEKPQPVITRDAPPRVLSTERVPCTSALLGSGDGLCAGVSGGPLGAPLFPTSVVVSEDEHAARDGLISLAIGVMTGGFIIPGHTDTSVVATMDSRPPPTLSALLTKWRKGAHTVAALQGLGLAEPLDAETAGALLVLGGAPAPGVVQALAQRVPKEDRWPVLRLARQQRLQPGGLVQVVAALSAAGALEAAPEGDALEASALLGLDDGLRAGVKALLAGRHPELRAVATRFGAAGFDATVLKALTTATLEPGEGGALAALLPIAVRTREAPRYLERLADDEALAVVKGLLENATPDERARFFLRVPKWVDRQLAAGRGKEVLELVSFDDERALVLNGAVVRTPEADRPAFLLTAASLFTFDAGRLGLLEKWKALLPALGVAQRRQLLALFGQGSERERALALLVAGVDASTRTELVLAVVASTSLDSAKVELLRSLQALDGAQARKVIAGCTFDSGKADLALALFPVVPAGERAALLIDTVRGMSFDDGRLKLLGALPELAHRLDAAQREAVLKSFTFERDRGAALLGP